MFGLCSGLLNFLSVRNGPRIGSPGELMFHWCTLYKQCRLFYNQKHKMQGNAQQIGRQMWKGKHSEYFRSKVVHVRESCEWGMDCWVLLLDPLSVS